MKIYIVPDIIEAVSLTHLCVIKQCIKCLKLVKSCPNIRCELLKVQFDEVSKSNEFHRMNDLPW